MTNLVSVPQLSFVGGEWAPSLYGRTDLAKYLTAVRTMKNMFAHPHGGASNRGGQAFVCEVKDSTKTNRLIPFQFSTVQSYVLEFGDQVMRVIKDGGLVLRTGAPDNTLEIVDAGTYKWTASGSGTNEYYCELDAGGDPSMVEPFRVSEDGTELDVGTMGSLSAGEWDWGDNDALGYSTVYVRLTDNTDPDSKADGFLEASYVVDIDTPWAHTDLALLKFTQSADTIYFTHPSYAVRKLTRSAHDNWTLSAVTFGSELDAPENLAGAGTSFYFVVTAVDELGRESVASDPDLADTGAALTWDAVTGAEYYNIYKDLYDAGTYGWIGQAIDEVFDEPAAGITPDYDKTPPLAKDPFDGPDNYPGCTTFFGQRLLFARTNNKVQSFWGSKVTDFECLDHSAPTQDDDGYEFQLASRQVNEIRWMVPLSHLILGTSGSEWKAGPGGDGDAITPTSIDATVQSQWGVSHVPPLVIGDTILFTESAGNVVRDLLYSLESDGYKGNDLSVLAKHLFRNYEITEWCYQQDPDSIVWAIRDDGTLLGMTYYREHEVWGWHQHETDGLYKSIASVSTSDDKDDVYVIVERVINGSTVKYVELFKERTPVDALYDHDIRDAYFVDSGLSLDSPLTITGVTNADPCVVTIAGHTFSDGDTIDFAVIVGNKDADGVDTLGAALNGKKFKIENSAANNFELTEATDTPTNIRSSTYKWTKSGSGTNEYYCEIAAGGDPSLTEPDSLKLDGTEATNGTVGSLNASEWDWGDNDSLGYDTVYVRLADDTDPDTWNNGYVTQYNHVHFDTSSYTTYKSGGEARKAVTSITGLTHLEGEEVAVLADGNVVDGLTVSSGAITLPNAAARVHVGLAYTGELETLDYDVQTDSGSVQDKIRGVRSCVFRLENTRSLWVGPPDGSDLYEEKFRTDEDYGEPTAPFTGDREVFIESSSDVRSSRVKVEVRDPVPLTILSLTARLEFEEAA